MNIGNLGRNIQRSINRFGGKSERFNQAFSGGLKRKNISERMREIRSQIELSRFQGEQNARKTVTEMQTRIKPVIGEKVVTEIQPEISTSTPGQRKSIKEIPHSITRTCVHFHGETGISSFEADIKSSDGMELGKACCSEGHGYWHIFPEHLCSDFILNGKRNGLNSKTDAVFISSLSTTGEFRGTGTEIIREIVKLSNELGHKGKVILLAAKTDYAGNKLYSGKSPVPFYFKLGFRFTDEKMNTKAAEAMENFEKTGVFDNNIRGWMWLSEEAAAKLLE